MILSDEIENLEPDDVKPRMSKCLSCGCMAMCTLAEAASKPVMGRSVFVVLHRALT